MQPWLPQRRNSPFTFLRPFATRRRLRSTHFFLKILLHILLTHFFIKGTQYIPFSTKNEKKSNIFAGRDCLIFLAQQIIIGSVCFRGS